MNKFLTNFFILSSLIACTSNNQSQPKLTPTPQSELKQAEHTPLKTENSKKPASPKKQSSKISMVVVSNKNSFKNHEVMADVALLMFNESRYQLFGKNDLAPKLSNPELQRLAKCSSVDCYASLKSNLKINQVLNIDKEPQKIVCTLYELNSAKVKTSQAKLSGEPDQQFKALEQALGELFKERDSLHSLGTIGAQPAQQVIEANKAPIHQCYAESLKTSNHQQATVGFTFVVDLDGTIGRIIVNPTTLANEQAENCAREQIKQWRFPAPKGGREIINLTLKITG